MITYCCIYEHDHERNKMRPVKLVYLCRFKNHLRLYIVTKGAEEQLRKVFQYFEIFRKEEHAEVYLAKIQNLYINFLYLSLADICSFIVVKKYIANLYI